MNKEIVGKNLLDKEPILTGKGLPKIIGITENQYYEYKQLQQENKQLKINCNIRNENLNFYRKENKQLKKDINTLIDIINRNCGELSTTDEEYETLKRWCR